MRTITEIESLELLHGITDGEWETSRAVSYHNNIPTVTEACVQRRGESVAIASEIIDPETGNVSEANARIMAAAPDLARTNVALYARLDAICAAVQNYFDASAAAVEARHADDDSGARGTFRSLVVQSRCNEAHIALASLITDKS